MRYSCVLVVANGGLKTVRKNTYVFENINSLHKMYVNDFSLLKVPAANY